MFNIFQFKTILILLICFSVIGCTNSGTSSETTTAERDRSTLNMEDALIGHWKTVSHDVSEYNVSTGTEYSKEAREKAKQSFQTIYQDWYFSESDLIMVNHASQQKKTYRYELVTQNNRDNTITLKITEKEAEKKTSTIDLALSIPQDEMFFDTNLKIEHTALEKSVDGTLIFDYQDQKTAP
jgi:hypothetical protein